jgi:hypothetical protein
VATAASITGFVRAYLFRALRQCEGLIYCDTDSIAARSIGNLQLGNELGQWKHELDCNYYAVAGKKTYAFRSVRDSYSEKEANDAHLIKGSQGYYKIASKGVRLTPDGIIAAASGSEITYSPQAPTYSIMRPEAIFVKRRVKMTARDISKMV